MDDPAMRAHYEAGVEEGRLVANGERRLELVRTLELLERYLPRPPAQILDVGGGPGVYAGVLAKRGYEVRLIDPVPLHVEQAEVASAAQPDKPFRARIGDARRLADADDSCDAALLLGPLYHLTERDDRLQALREARRVVRPGGPVLAVGISRFASVLDGLRAGYLLEPSFRQIVERDLREGQHRNPSSHPGWFTTAFFHHPEELVVEVEDSGLEVDALVGIEGPAAWFPGLWETEDGRDAALFAARAVEAEPSMLPVSPHLLVVGRAQA